MKTNFDDYVAVTEFMDKVQTQVDDKYNLYVPDKVLVHIFKLYEEFKKQQEDR